MPKARPLAQDDHGRRAHHHIAGSVAEDRKVGLGHGNLGAMLLRDETKCFAFLAGHESFAAAEGAIGIVRNANKARKEPLRVILNGLGKDAAQIISRINGWLALAAFAVLPFMFAFALILNKKMRRAFRANRVKIADINA